MCLVAYSHMHSHAIMHTHRLIIYHIIISYAKHARVLFLRRDTLHLEYMTLWSVHVVVRSSIDDHSLLQLNGCYVTGKVNRSIAVVW